MNEILPAQQQQKVGPLASGPSGPLIEAIDGSFALKSEEVADHLRRTIKYIRSGEKLGAQYLRAEIAKGEAILADSIFQTLADRLRPFVVTATVAQVKHELAKLLAAFPTKDDLTAFMPILGDEIMEEQPSWLALAIACRSLRRTCKFRPSIAEVLDAVYEADSAAGRGARIVALPKYVDTLRKFLIEAERLPTAPAKSTAITPFDRRSK
jgi:hypothetical protein